MVNYANNYWTLKSTARNFQGINMTALYADQILKEQCVEFIKSSLEPGLTPNKAFEEGYPGMAKPFYDIATTWWKSTSDYVKNYQRADGAPYNIGADVISEQCKQINRQFNPPYDEETLNKATEILVEILYGYTKNYPELRAPRPKPDKENTSFKTSL